MTVVKQTVVDTPPTQTNPGFIAAPNRSEEQEMLILLSSPLLQPDRETSLEQMAIDKEVEAIIQAIETVQPQKAIKITVEVATREVLWDIFVQRDTLPLILHYIGQGQDCSAGAAIVLEDREGIADPLSEEELRNILSARRNKENNCQLAFLNARNSGKLGNLLQEIGVESILSLSREDSLLNEASQIFAAQFYPQLFQNETISDSRLDAQRYLKVNKKIALEKEALVLQGNANQSLELKDGLTIKPTYPDYYLPPDKADTEFIGRKQELHQIAKYFSQQNNLCYALHGYGGMGKTSLAIAAAKWHQERKRFRDGVWFVELGGVTEVSTAENLLEAFTRKSREALLILDEIDDLGETGIISLLKDLKSNGYKILITSRKRLPRSIEYDYLNLEGLRDKDAEELLKKDLPRECWNESDAEFSDNLSAVMEYLSGYPLPLRLARAYMKNEKHSLAQLKTELWSAINDNNLPILRENRERSLSICLDLSYQALNRLPLTQVYFMILALFPSGINQTMTREVLGNGAVEHLETLFRYSLLEIDDPYQERRYKLLEPVKDYIQEKQKNEESCIEQDFWHKSFVEYIYPRVLEYYYEEISLKNKEVDNREILNLAYFLTWACDYERQDLFFQVNRNGVSRSARIIGNLGDKVSILPLNIELDRFLDTARRSQDVYGEAEVYRSLGMFKLKQIEEEKAQLYFSNAIEKYTRCLDSSKDMSEKADIKFKIASCHENLDRLQLALDNYQSSLNLYNELNDRLNIEKLERAIKRVKLKMSLKSFNFSVVKLNNQGTVSKIPKQSKLFVEKINKQVDIEMVYIPSGKFIMGSPESEKDSYNYERPEHEVTVSQFFMGRYPVTQAQWRTVAQLEPIALELKENPSHFPGDNLPVERVSWQEALEFCARLSKHTGKNYRLPSEAEWEYACRAGTTTPFHFGDTISTEVANYDGNYVYGSGKKGVYREKTTEVDFFAGANEFGLSGMHGNVWEWCLDPWHRNYLGATTDGSVWDENCNDNRYQNTLDNIHELIEDTRTHILRGGSWIDNPGYCRSAFRFDYGYRFWRDYYYVGFRLVCPPQD
jgi:formylglycine-generating enzyme required for sulfatase activity/copper chaperone CopZ